MPVDDVDDPFGSEEGDEEDGHRMRPRSPQGPASNLWGTKEILTDNWINLLLLFSPVGIVASLHHWSATWIFFSNFFPIIPLAYLLGRATEEVANRTGQVFGGFLNATFGNAVEVILAIVGLRQNMVELIQASLLGSILSNMLLVLGCAFFMGGLQHKKQTFNTAIAVTNCSLLYLAVMALSLPTVYKVIIPDNRNEIDMSHLAAAGLAFTYVQFLYFQMGTHSHLFEDAEEEADDPILTLFGAIFLMAIITIAVSVHTEFLVDAVEGTVKATGLNERFIGIILLPIIGNAAEHVSAVTVAMKNKMTLAVNIALGSATQISVCVIPMTVLIGWIMGVDMDLNFHVYEVLAMIVSVHLVAEVVRGGSSQWLAGSILMMAYVLIGAGFLYLPVLTDAEKGMA
uniref:Sodium/calcium exchanger membrane region domain-containing protein n=1 Tax=Eutreptiella gymnastica TaxID=73025 RepID=A0A7S1NHA8_9EUGL